MKGCVLALLMRGALRISSNKDGKICEYEYGDISIKGVY